MITITFITSNYKLLTLFVHRTKFLYKIVECTGKRRRGSVVIIFEDNDCCYWKYAKYELIYCQRFCIRNIVFERN